MAAMLISCEKIAPIQKPVQKRNCKMAQMYVIAPIENGTDAEMKRQNGTDAVPRADKRVQFCIKM